MSHDGHTIDAGPVKVLCVACRSDLDVRPCTEDGRCLCERCHVDEFGYSCEFTIEYKGRRCFVNQHPDPDEQAAGYA